MSIIFPGTITGTLQTGMTAPTYTTTPDVAPDQNGKQVAITALGGTQTGVTTHSVQSPFTITYWRPKVLKLLGAIGLNGQYPNVPLNKSTYTTRKGVTIAAGQPARVMTIRTEIEVPSGSETYDSINVRAALSAHSGLLGSTFAGGVGDTLVTNVM
jgi:hypothetical protein